jgi:hydroxyacylglutathione hydrolase
MLTVFPIPAFTDNYLWIIHDETSAIVFDPGIATPVIDYLTKHDLTLNAIMVTHNHWDHIDGIGDLRDWCGQDIPVYASNFDNIPHRTHIAVPGENVSNAALGLDFQVLHLPGHTTGHIAYYEANQGWLFSGDVLFAGGCGRLLGGTAAQMQASLATIRALPPTTQFFGVHEYTLANLRFAIVVEPNNVALQQRVIVETEKRAKNRPTLPSTIGLEIATNPFMRWDAEEVKLAAERASSGETSRNAAPDKVFAAIRGWKDWF